jgi:uncharacterized membrane-anchored protein
MHHKWAVVAVVAVMLAFVNVSVFKKESALRSGEQLYLRLAPLDPRSLMQGDYMILEFEVARKMLYLPELEGAKYVVVEVDERGVGEFVRLDDGSPLGPRERRVLFARRGKGAGVWIGADSFFFEEGRAKEFERARYGGLKLAASGAVVLEGMYDEALGRIK